MPHVSSEVTELDDEVDDEADDEADDEDVAEAIEVEDVDEAEEELGANEDEDVSPQATRNNAVRVEKTSRFFLFI